MNSAQDKLSGTWCSKPPVTMLRISAAPATITPHHKCLSLLSISSTKITNFGCAHQACKAIIADQRLQCRSMRNAACAPSVTILWAVLARRAAGGRRATRPAPDLPAGRHLLHSRNKTNPLSLSCPAGAAPEGPLRWLCHQALVRYCARGSIGLGQLRLRQSWSRHCLDGAAACT